MIMSVLQVACCYVHAYVMIHPPQQCPINSLNGLISNENHFAVFQTCVVVLMLADAAGREPFMITIPVSIVD